MTRALIIVAAAGLSACQLALPQLPTPAEICALPPAQRAVLVEALGSTVEAMAIACAVAG